MDEMNMRLVLRETALNVKNLVAEVSEEMKTAADKIARGNKEDTVSYLNSSRMYLQNVLNQLENF
jgi:hypothetical protein